MLCPSETVLGIMSSNVFNLSSMMIWSGARRRCRSDRCPQRSVQGLFPQLLYHGDQHLRASCNLQSEMLSLSPFARLFNHPPRRCILAPHGLDSSMQQTRCRMGLFNLSFSWIHSRGCLLFALQ